MELGLHDVWFQHCHQDVRMLDRQILLIFFCCSLANDLHSVLVDDALATGG